MTIVAPQKTRPQLAPTPSWCPPTTHQWVDGQFPGWLYCSACGQAALCKGCQADSGDDGQRYPDIFCPTHRAGDTQRYLQRPLTYRDIAARLIYLAGQIVSAAWTTTRFPDKPAIATASVEMPGYRLRLSYALVGNYWSVAVFVPGVEAVPVFFAEGPSTACQVKTVQPGSWMTAVISTLTLKDAQVVPHA